MIQIDTHEQKTPEALVKAFNAEVKPLKIADFLDTEKMVLIEFKIKQDVHSYMRLADEATRMDLEKYANFYKHAIYVDDFTLRSFNEYRIFASVCQHANIMSHFVIWDQDYFNLIREIKKISQPSYNKHIQIMKGHSKELSQRGKIISTFPLISDSNAHLIDLEMEHSDLYVAADKVMGLNQDGNSRRPVQNMKDFFQEFKKKL